VTDYASKPGLLKGLWGVLRNPAWLAMLWVGMSAGITLVAVPGLFGAEALTRAQAIGAASGLFSTFDSVQIGLLIVLLTLTRLSDQLRARLFPLLGITLVVLLQSAWLLPELMGRAAMIAAGQEPPPSPAHALYSLLEIAKIVLLLVIAFVPARRPNPD